MSGLALQGMSVAISGDGNTAIVGGSANNNNDGAVWIFTRGQLGWSQQGLRLTGDPGSQFGHFGRSVGRRQHRPRGRACFQLERGRGGGFRPQRRGLDGAKRAGRYRRGRSRISRPFRRAVGRRQYRDRRWIRRQLPGRGVGLHPKRQQLMVSAGIEAGRFRRGRGQGPSLGFSVALSADGNTALAGGPTDSSLIGAAWVFTRSGTVWTQQGAKRVGDLATPVAPKKGSRSRCPATARPASWGDPPTTPTSEQPGCS